MNLQEHFRFLICVDDLGQKFPSALEGFQQRVLENKSPAGEFLQAFREHLTDMYKYWDKIPANLINLSAIDFINGCLLEEMPVIRDMKVSPDARSWPFYLRNKTGTAVAYAFMLFPKDLHPDMSEYIQVIDDMNLYICLANDVLSFYKEYLAGETNNYISIRAKNTQKSLEDALQDTVNDTLAAHDRITKVLEHTSAYVPWKNFVTGYLAFHFGLKRYRLSELGF
ncbi:isoprenoid synthase domain-containing protein [Gymnopilus junonius]|uniref:Isoprenoid synthase domain-containing protein n=1 Tax=Gymnopilus junonius TaxID=109634 RepID=A0A9P5NLD7_GYMJU|nr:isoprenoid synthase domain-containing protein [Gymnopilus junonius]